MNGRIVCGVLLFLSLPFAWPVVAAAEPELTAAEQVKFASLTRDLNSPDPETLDLALGEMVRMGPRARGALGQLTEMLSDGRQLIYVTPRNITGHRSFQVNLSVVAVLRGIGPPAVPALVKALDNENDDVRIQAISALGNVRQHVDLAVWRNALQDSHPNVRWYAARAIALSKTPATVDALIPVLQDPDMKVRIEAAKALGEIGDIRAIEPLIDALPNGQMDLPLKYAIGMALAKFGEPSVKALLKRVDSLDENGRQMVGIAIRETDASSTQSLLLECLKNDHWEVREAAVHALGGLKTPVSLRVAIESVEDRHWNVRWTAIRWLGKLADDESADAIRQILLKKTLHDPEPKVRSNAIWTLYFFPGIPTNPYWETLEAALNDPSPRVRAKAALSCSKFPNIRFEARLKELLQDPDGEVRKEAAAALRQLPVDPGEDEESS